MAISRFHVLHNNNNPSFKAFNLNMIKPAVILVISPLIRRLGQSNRPPCIIKSSQTIQSK